ncbi:MAG TPA: hypothetical protein VLW05_00900 [Gaiellaceae bacterium]|nr:hypothetical protein [Gaiellaceae bacterium]
MGGIVNTRNAVVGYAVVKGGKYALKNKARESASPRAGAWAAGTLAAAAFLVWKKRRRRAKTAVE